MRWEMRSRAVCWNNLAKARRHGGVVSLEEDGGVRLLSNSLQLSEGTKENPDDLMDLERAWYSGGVVAVGCPLCEEIALPERGSED